MNYIPIRAFLESVFNVHSSVTFHVQILQRSKDGHDKSTRLITEWFVGSLDRFDLIIPAIKLLCKEYKARCYINLNPKSNKQVVYKLLKNVVERVETGSYHINSILSHCHDGIYSNTGKTWVVDIDDKDVDTNKLIIDINKCRSGHKKNVIMCLPTKNGKHIITHPFDVTQLQLPDGVEIKKNNPTLLDYDNS